MRPVDSVTALPYGFPFLESERSIPNASGNPTIAASSIPAPARMERLDIRQREGNRCKCGFDQAGILMQPCRVPDGLPIRKICE